MKNRLNAFIACTIVLGVLVGCGGGTLNSEGYKASTPEWQSAAEKYSCTTDQMNKVETEHKFCKENTSYFSSYCYGSAIMRNCKKKEDVK